MVHMTKSQFSKNLSEGSGFLSYHVIVIPCALRLKYSCVCIEYDLSALFGVAAYRPAVVLTPSLTPFTVYFV